MSSIILTGKTASGKTSICFKILENLKSNGKSCGGVLTPVNPDGSRNIIDVSSCKQLPFCGLKPVFDGPVVGRYFFNKRAFDFGIKAILKSLYGKNVLTFVDEFGPLEISGEGFASVLPHLNNPSAGNILLVVRFPLLDKITEKLFFPFHIFKTGQEPAESLAQKILKSVFEN